MKTIQGLLSIVGIGPSAPKATPQTMSTQPEQAVTSDAQTASKARAALYSTEGGAAGVDLNPNQIQQRQTLFGN